MVSSKLRLDHWSDPGANSDRNGQPRFVYHAYLCLSRFCLLNEFRHEPFEREILECDHRIGGGPVRGHHCPKFFCESMGAAAGSP